MTVTHIIFKYQNNAKHDVYMSKTVVNFLFTVIASESYTDDPATSTLSLLSTSRKSLGNTNSSGRSGKLL